MPYHWDKSRIPFARGNFGAIKRAKTPSFVPKYRRTRPDTA